MSEDEYNFPLLINDEEEEDGDEESGIASSKTQSDYHDPQHMCQLITHNVENSLCRESWLSIIYHLALINNKQNGHHYWSTIDLLVQQMLLQIDGADVDVDAFKLLDMREIIEKYSTLFVFLSLY